MDQELISTVVMDQQVLFEHLNGTARRKILACTHNQRPKLEMYMAATRRVKRPAKAAHTSRNIAPITKIGIIAGDRVDTRPSARMANKNPDARNVGVLPFEAETAVRGV